MKKRVGQIVLLLLLQYEPTLTEEATIIKRKESPA